MYEVILGAPSTALTGTAANMNATASEPLVSDLSRAVFSATDTTDTDASGYFIDSCWISNVRVQSGAESLLRGATAQMAASGLSPLRGMKSVNGWGQHAQDAGEFVGIVAGTDSGLGITGAFAVPARPKNPRSRIASPSNVPGVSFSSFTAIATGPGAVTLTAPEDLIVDLSSLVLGASGAIGANLKWLDQLQAFDVNGIVLPSGENIVIGQNTPVAPAMAFHGKRSFDFFDLGCIRIGSGASIRLNVTNLGDATQDLNVSFQAYTSAQARKGGCSC